MSTAAAMRPNGAGNDFEVPDAIQRGAHVVDGDAPPGRRGRRLPRRRLTRAGARRPGDDLAGRHLTRGIGGIGSQAFEQVAQASLLQVGEHPARRLLAPLPLHEIEQLAGLGRRSLHHTRSLASFAR